MGNYSKWLLCNGLWLITFIKKYVIFFLYAYAIALVKRKTLNDLKRDILDVIGTVTEQLFS